MSVSRRYYLCKYSYLGGGEVICAKNKEDAREAFVKEKRESFAKRGLVFDDECEKAVTITWIPGAWVDGRRKLRE